MNRDNVNEMDRIQRGLEEFLEQELEEYCRQQEPEREEQAAEQRSKQEAAEQRSEQQAPERAGGFGAAGVSPERAGGFGAAGVSSERAGGFEAAGVSSERRKSGKIQKKGEQKMAGKKRKKKRKKKSFLKKLVVVAAMLCLLAAGVWYYSVNRMYDKVNFQEIESVATEPMKEDEVINILLIGNDSRTEGEDGRSDAMILVSISNQTKKIHMVSLLRDMYVEIPGHKNNRLNVAYAYGGPALLMETLEKNFDLSVNRYVLVNFQAFANLIDAVGGVDLELTNEEVKYVNGYLVEYNILEGNPAGTHYLDTSLSGLVHLNGPQALAYCRNRQIGTDFARTERQRKVLTAIIDKAPTALLTNLGELVDSILPNLTTNLTAKECRNLTLQASKLLTYDIVQGSIPIDGSYSNASIRGMSVLEVDFEANKEYIRTNIYGEVGEEAGVQREIGGF